MKPEVMLVSEKPTFPNWREGATKMDDLLDSAACP
jgi:hypothetical protein